MKDQILKLIKEGHNKSYIRDTLRVSEHLITQTKKEQSNPHLPPIEQAIRMLECDKTHQEVQERWGEEVLSEALTFHQDILSKEEYCEIHGCVE